jgi:ApbE superfamily uncharacterized protein (UPF0280 family)
MSGRGARPTCARLDTGRWHLQHGPIDLVLEADGERGACDAALADCWERFQDVLPRLVSELPSLRRPARAGQSLQGTVARRMLRACMPFAPERFITPMAAVAGAVADEMIQSFHRRGVQRAFINNGGDIALHLLPGTQYCLGVWSDLARLRAPPAAPRALDAVFSIEAAMPVRGVATSGWRGRSFSLGIADSVTVLADCAAAADAAATLIANAVDCDAAGILRAPAATLKDDTDLGSRLVTVSVPPLPAAAIVQALARGREEAQYWQAHGLIHAAVLWLQGAVECVLPDAPLPARAPLPAGRAARAALAALAGVTE